MSSGVMSLVSILGCSRSLSDRAEAQRQAVVEAVWESVQARDLVKQGVAWPVSWSRRRRSLGMLVAPSVEERGEGEGGTGRRCWVVKSSPPPTRLWPCSGCRPREPGVEDAGTTRSRAGALDVGAGSGGEALLGLVSSSSSSVAEPDGRLLI
ncbi:hypothetical protein BC567DRAFT_234809 [Phyllosticta citribraziliensis]